MHEQRQLYFLMTVFQSIDKSGGNPQIIYPLFRNNLSLIDEKIIPILSIWHQAKFTQTNENGKKFITNLISRFANLIVQFPLGSRIINLEIAIVCYRLALDARAYESHPEDWAMTQVNLANVYQYRIQGEKAANIEESIAYYHLALKVYTHAAYPERWADTQMNLANAYQHRILGERAANLEESIACYRLALEIYTRAAYPKDWARTQMNLAVAYKSRIKGERAENLEESISCYRLALEIRTRAAYPEQWAMTQMNLANAYSDRIDGERTMNLVIAIECFKSALKIYTPELLPLDCLRTANNLGSIYFKQGNWQLAIDAYELAMQSVETSRSWATSDASRQELLRKSLPVYENAIQSAVNIGNYQLAIQYTERVRSRQLVELMASKDLYNNAEIPDEIQQYLHGDFGIVVEIFTCHQFDKLTTTDSFCVLDGELVVTDVDG